MHSSYTGFARITKVIEKLLSKLPLTLQTAFLIGKQGHLLRLSGNVLLKRKDLFHTQLEQLSKPLSFSNAVCD